MELPYFHVDAFTDAPFRGNPAGVCMLPGEWLDDELMGQIAMENNLSETAFLILKPNHCLLRWFSPAMEIDLCGHATLACGAVLFQNREWPSDTVYFDTKSGRLTVRREGDSYYLTLPARPARVVAPPKGLTEALGLEPEQTLAARDLICVLENEEQVRTLKPDIRLIGQLEAFGVAVTAPGRECDFVSRFFVPKAGVDEDPVTGSTHCTLAPYWAERLKKTELSARQLSARGGQLACQLLGQSVELGGKARLYSSGMIQI